MDHGVGVARVGKVVWRDRTKLGVSFDRPPPRHGASVEAGPIRAGLVVRQYGPLIQIKSIPDQHIVRIAQRGIQE